MNMAPGSEPTAFCCCDKHVGRGSLADVVGHTHGHTVVGEG